MTFEVRTFEARTVSWWYRSREDIDFNPPYQRKGQVWELARRSFLIDTVLNDFDMPKLYLADFTYYRSPLNRSGARFAVIDGKQRLSALFGFLDDEVPLPQDFVLRDNPDLSLGGLTYSQLRDMEPQLAAKVENFNLPVMSVITDDEQSVQELFVRLNSGKPLTAAERRTAMPGVVPQYVREIASSTFFTRCVGFSSRGGAHEQAAAKLLLLELEGGKPIDLKRSQLDRLYIDGERLFGDGLPEATSSVMETLAPMSEAFMPNDPLLRSQGQLPVYFLLFRAGNMPWDVRERIDDFHRLRLSVRRVELGAAPMVDVGGRMYEQVVQYDHFMRNPNDARSVYFMYEILASIVQLTTS